MFLELTEEVYEKMRPVLFDMEVDCEVSECTLPSEEVRHLHLEFGDITEEQAKEIARQTDMCFASAAMESRSQALKAAGGA